MEPPSASPRRGGVHWQGSLLTVSLLIFWSPSIPAQPTIESVPLNAAEGNDVLLLLSNPPEDIFVYIWYKGESTGNNDRIVSYASQVQIQALGPAYTGRETIYHNGSLLIQNVTLNHSGVYTLQITTMFGPTEIAGQIRVYPALPTPFIISNSSNPVEDQDSVTLTCYPETQNTTYLWLINNQSLPETDRLELSSDNRTLTVYSVTRNDTGSYECRTRNEVNSRRSDPFILNVLYGPDTPTISPSYWYYPPGANLILSCNATSNPPAQYSWLINGTYLQSTQVLFIPNITASHSGNYTCHVHNNATGFNRTTVKSITVSESVTKPSIQASSTTVTENEGPVTLTCLTNHAEISIRWIFKGQILPLTERTTLSQDNSSLTIDPIRREDTGEYQCEVYNPVSSNKSDPLNLTVTYPPPEIPGLSGGAIAGIVVGAVAVVAVVVALVYFLCIRNTARASDQRDNTEHKPSASNHSQDHSDTDNEVAYSSLNFKAQQPEKSTSAFPSPTATETIYSEVKKK
nr:carcinoembryonic antigen-related cell adhesion molecule 1 isoform X3 [Loxodonta africana]